jgi:hypothetical protein
VATHGLSKTIRTGLVDFERLDEDDAFEFGYWAIGVMHSLDNAYYQYRVGMLDGDRWEMQRAIILDFFRNPSFVQWWKTAAPQSLSPEFVALVSEILGEEPERADRPQ